MIEISASRSTHDQIVRLTWVLSSGSTDALSSKYAFNLLATSSSNACTVGGSSGGGGAASTAATLGADAAEAPDGEALDCSCALEDCVMAISSRRDVAASSL